MKHILLIGLLLSAAVLLPSSSPVQARGGAPSTAHIPALFAVGLNGGFTGAAMTATVYADGTVRVVRSGGPGGGGLPLDSHVPLSGSAVRAAVRLANAGRIFTLPADLQHRSPGADFITHTLKVFGPAGARKVQAIGADDSHLPGTGAFWPVWGLFYAVAGFPPQFAASR